MGTNRPSILKYTDLVRSYGVGSSQSTAYRKTYAGDITFQRRADTVDFLFANGDRVSRSFERE